MEGLILYHIFFNPKFQKYFRVSPLTAKYLIISKKRNNIVRVGLKVLQ